MRNYNENVKDYLSEEILGDFETGIGDPLAFIPFEEIEANFCYLDSIIRNGDSFIMTMRVENEFTGEKYKKEYVVKKGTKLEVNTFEMPLMCFLPPEKVPVLAEVLEISENELKMQTVGVLQEYADDLDNRAASFTNIQKN